MKSKFLERIVGAGLAFSLSFSVGCQMLEKSVKDFAYIPPSSEKAEQDLKKRVDEQIKKIAKENKILFTYEDDYKVTRNSLTTTEQKEILDRKLEQIAGEYKPKYNTSAHRTLGMEQEFGATVEDYKTLDDLLDKIIPEIQIKSAYTKKDVFNIFRTIASKLIDFKREENTLLSYGLREKIFDCDNFSLVYSSVGEILNLPIKMINVLNHVFIRWDLGKEHLNWDNMWGKEENKAFLDWVYKVNFGLDALFVEMGKKEITAMNYFNRGTYLFDQEKYEESLDEFNTALELYPNFMMALYNKGYTLLELEDYQGALNSFNKVINKNSKFANGYNACGLVYTRMEFYDKAIEQFTKAIELEPELNIIYKNRSETWEKIGNSENAEKDRKQYFLLKFNDFTEDGIIWVEE
ncbi:MAG: tetratricopeptide repeat protein [Candidatus Pacearchaeota archaeon]|nr:tetratricopeptide repeat protein [Candidatus Pacearchaeota archaeon]